MTAVCDLWKVNREAAVAAEREYYGRAPRSFQYMEDLLALKDVDAVLISTPDHQHAPMLKLVAEAGKDAYCEKPMANDLDEVKAARDAVRRRTASCRSARSTAASRTRSRRELIARGELGEVSKVEIVWNYHGPRWRGRPEVQQLREEDTDWQPWLLRGPTGPSTRACTSSSASTREFSSGIPTSG